ncbi:MAG: hypothetical protein ACHQK9_13560 [Reyranellales bacterium]
MGRSMNMLVIAGTILLGAGALGLAVPVFVTQQTTDVLRIGDLKVQANESVSHVIPPLLSAAALIAGVVLLGAGFYRKTGS